MEMSLFFILHLGRNYLSIGEDVRCIDVSVRGGGWVLLLSNIQEKILRIMLMLCEDKVFALESVGGWIFPMRFF